MPSGSYPRNQKHLDALARARSFIVRGPVSEETKRKISEAKKKRVTENCSYCGGLVSIKPSVAKRYGRHFCSRRCYSDFRRHLLPKEEQHAYGTGHSDEERQRRIKCRSITNHAIRDGKLTRMPCEKCGELPSEAHHENYDKPLDVRWLCPRHHRDIHKRYGRPLRS